MKLVKRLVKLNLPESERGHLTPAGHFRCVFKLYSFLLTSYSFGVHTCSEVGHIYSRILSLTLLSAIVIERLRKPALWDISLEFERGDS